MMRRIGRVVGVVDARRVDADEPYSQLQEKVRPSSRQTGTCTQVRRRAPMPPPAAGATQDRAPLPDGAARRAHRGPQVLGQDPAFLREAAKVEDVTRCDESIERYLMELAALRLEVERRIDVRAGVADKEQGLREEPMDLARRPLRETRRRIGGEHLGVRPNGLGEVDDARELAEPSVRYNELLLHRRMAPAGLTGFLRRTLLLRDRIRMPDVVR